MWALKRCADAAPAGHSAPRGARQPEKQGRRAAARHGPQHRAGRRRQRQCPGSGRAITRPPGCPRTSAMIPVATPRTPYSMHIDQRDLGPGRAQHLQHGGVIKPGARARRDGARQHQQAGQDGDQAGGADALGQLLQQRVAPGRWRPSPARWRCWGSGRSPPCTWRFPRSGVDPDGGQEGMRRLVDQAGRQHQHEILPAGGEIHLAQAGDAAVDLAAQHIQASCCRRS